MTFLAPSYLYGLFALAIPIIIHFFSFRKTKTVYFSNTRFLLQVNKKTSSRRNIKRYLILLARLLFITALVFAFAQPVKYLGTTKNNDSKAVLFVVDNSLSMTSKNEYNVTLFEDAISQINKMTGYYSKDTPFYIFTNSFSVADFSKYDQESLVDRLTELNLSAESKSFNDIFNRIKILIKNQKLSGLKVYWFSDFQKSVFKTVNLDESIQSDSTTLISILPFIAQTQKNVYIDSVYLDNPYVSGYEKTIINVLVRNSGTIPALKVPIKLIINNVQVATVVSDIGNQDEKVITFQVQTLSESENPAQIVVKDTDIHFDNTFYFNLKKGTPTKICAIHGINVDGDNIDNVYAENSMFKYYAYNENNIDFGQLQQADFIILNQIKNYSDGLSEKINSILDTQLSRIFFIPNKNDNIPKNLLNIGENLTYVNDSTQFDISIAYQKEILFKNVFEQEDYTENTFLTVAKKVIDLNNFNHSILKFNDGTSFLARYGIQHSIYVLSTPLSNDYTNFHLTSIFVPLMYKLAIHQLKDQEPLYYNLKNKSIQVPLDTVYANTIYKLKRENQEYITPQRIINTDLLMELSNQNLTAGFYELYNTGRHLAFNTSKEESNILNYTTKELQNIFASWKNITVQDGKNNEDRIDDIKANVQGQIFSNYFIILALLFLLSEILLIRMWKP